MMRMNEAAFVKTTNEGMIKGDGIKGRPSVKWNNMDDYRRGRKIFGRQGNECTEWKHQHYNRGYWRGFQCGHPLGEGSCDGTGSKIYIYK